MKTVDVTYLSDYTRKLLSFSYFYLHVPVCLFSFCFHISAQKWTALAKYKFSQTYHVSEMWRVEHFSGFEISSKIGSETPFSTLYPPNVEA